MFMPPTPASRNLRPTEGMASYRSTNSPAWARTSAAIRPAGPPPMMATGRAGCDMRGKWLGKRPRFYRRERIAGLLRIALFRSGECRPPGGQGAAGVDRVAWAAGECTGRPHCDSGAQGPGVAEQEESTHQLLVLAGPVGGEHGRIQLALLAQFVQFRPFEVYAHRAGGTVQNAQMGIGAVQPGVDQIGHRASLL